MRGRIVIHHVRRLGCPDSQHVRHVRATFLLDNDRLGRRIKRAVSQSFGNEHDHILQIAFRIGHYFLRKCR